MVSVLIALLLLLTVAYVLTLFWLRNGLARLPLPRSSEQPFVTVLIAARNEEKNLGRCLRSLLSQDYPADRYEVLVVDDRSTDRTSEVAERLALRHANLRLLRIDDLDPDMAPKKRALTLGIEEARGDVILTTDADCVVPPRWISTMMRHFGQGVGFVAGYTAYEVGPAAGIWQKLLALEYYALACVGAAGIGNRFSLTCTGGNMGYRKETFWEVGGYHSVRHLISGDDDLLLHLINQNTDWQIRYAFEPAARTWTRPPGSLSEFFHQRVRYASKGRHYRKALALSLTGVWLYNALLLVTPLVSFFVPLYAAAALASLAAKAAAEIAFLLRGSRVLRQDDLLRYYPVASVLHVPYVVLFGALGQVGSFRWKGHSFESRLQPEPALEETQFAEWNDL